MAAIDIAFAGDNTREAVFPCRACGARQSRHSLTVHSPGSVLELFECGACGSFFFDGEDPVLGYEFLPYGEYWLDYAQGGAGIITMLSPLFALGDLPEGDMIDVGCGFGFVVDYWARNRGAAVGLERSAFGAQGAKMLGADIRPLYLDGFREQEPERRFSIVYSSEVIEHVADPAAFLAELVGMMDDDGLLVLTTPDSSAISPETPRPKVIAALSPQFHYAIFSQQRMRQMVEALGLQVHIEVHDGQMVVWASRGPLPEISYGAFDWTEYFAYLNDLAENEDPHLAIGALFRLFKDAMNTDHPEMSSWAWDRFLPRCQETYGIDLRAPDLGELMKLRKPLEQLERYPNWLGAALLFGGLHLGHYEGDRRTKLRMLEAALRVLRRRAEVDLQFGQEAASYLPFAERQYLIALSEALNVGVTAPDAPLEQKDLRASLKALQQVLGELLAEDDQDATAGTGES